jgi:hypothetical protein
MMTSMRVNPFDHSFLGPGLSSKKKRMRSKSIPRLMSASDGVVLSPRKVWGIPRNDEAGSSLDQQLARASQGSVAQGFGMGRTLQTPRQGCP